MYYVYMIRCRGDTIYTGITPDPCRRMQAHAGGTGARYTRSHPPEALEALWRVGDRGEASRLEYAFKKKLDRQRKLELIRDPGRLPELLPDLAAVGCEPVAGVTLEDLLEGRFDG